MTIYAKKILSWLIKAAILVLTFYFIYHQFVKKHDALNDFTNHLKTVGQNQVIITLGFVVLLMLVNWVLESFKWCYLTLELANLTIWQAIEGVFHGLTWAIITPNRLGEYGGRIMFLPPRKRIHGVFAMAVGAFAQNVITNVLGASSGILFLYLYVSVNSLLFAGLCVGAFFLIAGFLVFYFNINWLVRFLNSIRFLKKYHRFFDIMGRYKKADLLNIMFFSLARFFVFSFQYYLVIHLLIPQISLATMMLVIFVFLFIQSAIPSLDVIDIGVRSLTATTLFSYVTQQPVAVIAAVSSIWFINLIIPAILGSVFVLKLKFFDRNS
ncbi:lysylphosphatidylglycerol synthase domain-containing protein [Mucilaginibacter gynuensis]|uniref:Lysylphosphatidylglycerol synthase domain-containing protein n=1 Tax=Mucilaginibacter gynuensis TaxID=1302236 RepID=A0ABP8GH44_9SPHI